MKSNNSIAIFGANGFIGKNLTYKLSNNYKLSLLSRNFDERFFSQIRNVDFFKSDFANSNVIKEIISNCNTAILSLKNHDTRTDEGISDLVKDDILPFAQFFDIIKNSNHKLKKIILLSSGGTIYGGEFIRPFKEDDPQNPVGFYASSRAFMENILLSFAKKYKIKSVILRVSNPYGPWQVRQGVVNQIFKSLLLDREFNVIGNIKNTRDYIFIDDLIQAISKVIELDIEGILNIGTEHGNNIMNLIKIAERITNKKIRKKCSKSHELEISSNIISIEKAKRLLNWKPETSLVEGMEKSYKFYKDYYL